MRVNRQRRSQSKSIPAPIGGLNDLNSISDMPPEDAIILDNWFPGTRDVEIRGGTVLYSSGLPSQGQSLIPYQTTKLFAAAGTAIYDVTTSTATSVVTGKSNAKWDYVQFENNGGVFLCLCNGLDVPMFYNGTTWNYSGQSGGFATLITDGSGLGLLSSINNFSAVTTWKNRVWFVEKGTTRAWYLGTGAIGGAANFIDIGGVARKGGTIIAITSIPSSAGVTPDDYFCAFTSNGEAIVYRGTDPTSASTFYLVGNYQVGRPIANGSDNEGTRWIAKYAADIVAITGSGFTTLQAMFNADNVANQVTINAKIINTVQQSVNDFAANFGWQVIVSSFHHKLIINVPTSASTSFQYVMNTVTGAWCTFGYINSPINATCFCTWGDDIYCIIDTQVYKYDVSQSDDNVSASNPGTPIIAYAQTAYQYFGTDAQIKQFHMCKPTIYCSPGLSINIGLSIDFSTNPPANTFTGSTNAFNSLWGTAIWGTNLWSSSTQTINNWLSVNGMGYAASLGISVQSVNQFCNWQSWAVQFELGGLI